MAIDKKEKNIVLRFSHIGDIILLTGVLAYYHKHFAQQFIIVTQKGMTELFNNNPAVLDVIELERDELKGKKLINKAQEIAKAYHYPLYDLHDNLRSKLFKAVYKLKGNAVYTYEKDALARRFFLISKGKCRSEKLDLHVIERYAKAFAHTKQIPPKNEILPNLFLQEEERNFASDFYKKRNMQDKKVVVLHPFATHKGKMWHEEHWHTLYTLLLENNYFPLVIGKGDSFKWLSEEHNGLNTFTLRESAALIEKASCMITGDSAPLHLATAVKTRVIALFGATVKEWGFYPLRENDVLLQETMPCMPCSLHGKKLDCKMDYACLNKISPKNVFELISA